MTSTDSIPSGGTAFKSTATLRDSLPFQHELSTNWIPAAPAAMRILQPSRAAVVWSLEEVSTPVTASDCNRSFIVAAASIARVWLRDPIRTVAPAPANNRAARTPTGPVPARIVAVAPFNSICRAAANTAAAAVVLQPLESIITETRIGPKKTLLIFSIIASPLATSDPPTKIAV